MAESAFARKQLEKQGWKEGDGLGKNRDGISKPIKASLKMDKTGVGHSAGSEFTDHWWLRVFNDAASSITKSPQNTEITEKPTLPQKIYKGFVRGTVLSNGKEEKDSDCCSSDDEEPELSTSSSGLPTLDDLYKFCDGATGSRAGALGMKMKGKLHRAAEQERLFNEGKSSAKTETENGNSEEGECKEKRKKKKKKSSKQVDDITETDDTEKTTENGSLMPKISQGSKENDETEELIRIKHKKNKKRKREEDRITDQVLCESEEKTTAVKKGKKTKEVEPNHASGEENVESVCEEMNGHVKQKKKKKKRKD